MAQRSFGLGHLNGNLLCVVDCETTGDRPGFHDVVQVCFLPLDGMLKPAKGITPFYCSIQPKRPENIDPDVMKKGRTIILDAMTNGLEAYRAADLFDEWYKHLNLGYEKRIAPLAQNWPFDCEFVSDWLGRESCKQYFDSRYRDSMVAATFMNDRADFQGEPLPHAKVNLQYLASTYKVEHQRAHDALQDCIVTAEIYRLMCKS